MEELSSKSIKSESELIGLQNSNKTLDLNHVILKKSREIQISKLKELRDEAEKMQEDQAQCDQVEAQLKQVSLKSYPCNGVKRSNSALTGRGRCRANNNFRAHLNFYF